MFIAPSHALALLGLAAAFAVGAPEADAQGAVRTLDPFYQDESARRDFYGGFSVAGELAYRTADLLRPTGGGDFAGDMALSVQVDYALLPRVDVAAVVDLSGGIGRGPMGLSWVVVKPYWYNEDTDYAIRLAVDPASEGGLGFRQTDVAFLSTTTHSPTLTSDFTIGLRRVRSGYDASLEDATGEDPLFGGDPVTGGSPIATTAAALAAEGDRVRVLGREIHATWGYNLVLDPGGSRVSVALLGEAGDFRLIRTAVGGSEALPAAEERVRSGIGWLRAGFEWSRPSYQFGPYLAVPIVTWADVRGEPIRHGPQPERARFGFRLTLR